MGDVLSYPGPIDVTVIRAGLDLTVKMVTDYIYLNVDFCFKYR